MYRVTVDVDGILKAYCFKNEKAMTTFCAICNGKAVKYVIDEITEDEFNPTPTFVI